MVDFDTFTKIAKECGQFGQIIVAKGFKIRPKSNKLPNLVTLSMTSSPTWLEI